MAHSPKSTDRVGNDTPAASSGSTTALAEGLADALAPGSRPATPPGPAPGERAREQRAILAAMASRRRTSATGEPPAPQGAARGRFTELFRHLRREAAGDPPLDAAPLRHIRAGRTLVEDAPWSAAEPDEADAGRPVASRDDVQPVVRDRLLATIDAAFDHPRADARDAEPSDPGENVAEGVGTASVDTVVPRADPDVPAADPASVASIAGGDAFDVPRPSKPSVPVLPRDAEDEAPPVATDAVQWDDATGFTPSPMEAAGAADFDAPGDGADSRPHRAPPVPGRAGAPAASLHGDDVAPASRRDPEGEDHLGVVRALVPLGRAADEPGPPPSSPAPSNPARSGSLPSGPALSSPPPSSPALSSPPPSNPAPSRNLPPHRAPAVVELGFTRDEPVADKISPIPTHRAVEVSPGYGGGVAEPASDGRRMLLRDARRTWMSSGFKRTPHAVLMLSLRLARVPSANTPAAAALLSRTGKGMRQAVETLGPVYELTPCVYAVLLKENSLRQVVRIAEAIGVAMDKRSAENPLSPLLFSAGVAAIHRDDDPVAIVCLAEACLRTADTSETSRVVSESDPEVRRKHR